MENQKEVIHVDDLADALFFMKKTKHFLINIGTGKITQLNLLRINC